MRIITPIFTIGFRVERGIWVYWLVIKIGLKRPCRADWKYDWGIDKELSHDR